MDWFSVFFTFGGETGLINENEGDIQGPPQTCGRGGIGRRAALRSLWANPRGSSSLLGRTIPPFVETYILQQIAFCALILSGLCWTVLDTLHRKLRAYPQIAGLFTAKLICRFLLAIV